MEGSPPPQFLIADEEAAIQYKESTVLEKYAENFRQFDSPVRIGMDKKIHHSHCRVPGARPLSTGGPILIPDAIGLFHGPKPGHEDDNLPPKEIEEVLLHIFPPVDEEGEEGKVSQTIAIDIDVNSLNKAVEMWLKERHTTRCQWFGTQRRFFTLCIDELIRHEILDCSERGVVLIWRRNDLINASVKFVKFKSSNELLDRLDLIIKEIAGLSPNPLEWQNKKDSLEKLCKENIEPYAMDYEHKELTEMEAPVRFHSLAWKILRKFFQWAFD